MADEGGEAGLPSTSFLGLFRLFSCSSKAQVGNAQPAPGILEWYTRFVANSLVQAKNHMKTRPNPPLFSWFSAIYADFKFLADRHVHALKPFVLKIFNYNVLIVGDKCIGLFNVC